MKNFKKIVSLVLVVVSVFAMSTIAFAESEAEPEPSRTEHSLDDETFTYHGKEYNGITFASYMESIGPLAASCRCYNHYTEEEPWIEYDGLEKELSSYDNCYHYGRSYPTEVDGVTYVYDDGFNWICAEENPAYLYREVEDGIAITSNLGYLGYDKYFESFTSSYTVPSSLDGKTVTELARGLGCYLLYIDELIIPDSVKRINADAFFNPKIKQRVILGSGIECLSTEWLSINSYGPIDLYCVASKEQMDKVLVWENLWHRHHTWDKVDWANTELNHDFAKVHYDVDVDSLPELKDDSVAEATIFDKIIAFFQQIIEFFENLFSFSWIK